MIEFDMIDKATLARLKRRKLPNLPKAKNLNITKDQQWNLKMFNSQLLAGIQSGENVKKIADRILPEITAKSLATGDNVVKKNMQSAIRNARTMVTEAENSGRLDSYKQLDKKGVVQKKVWEATPDDRTRKSHIDIDGEEQDIDKPFSNGCMYPADGKGPADEVWNCRCSMRDHIIGFKDRWGGVIKVNYGRDVTMHAAQIETQKQMLAARRAAVKAKGLDKKPVFDKEAWLADLKANNSKEAEFIDDMNSWLDRISPSEKDGVRTYTGGAYVDMNKYLRGFRDTTRYETEIKNCASALEKASLPRDVIVRRGSDIRSIEGLLGVEIPSPYERTEEWAKSLVGSLGSDKGFFSATPMTYGGFNDEIEYVIKFPEGANAVYVDPISKNKGELEILANKDSSFLVEEVEITGYYSLRVFLTML